LLDSLLQEKKVFLKNGDQESDKFKKEKGVERAKL